MLAWMEKLKVLFVARKPLGELVTELKDIKRGYKTFSFWATVIGTLGSAFAAIQGFIPVTTAVLISTGLGVVYNLARGLTKADEIGIRPTLGSTEFWVGALAIFSNGIVQLQTAGISDKWVALAGTILAAAMAAAQTVGAQQPKPIE